MATSPVIPQSIKSFWSRPEGKVGLIFLAVAAGFLTLWGWGTIVPFLVSMMVDTFHLALLVGGAIASFMILTSKRTHMMFRVAMRALTGIFITIDPIGILKDKLSEMRKRRAKLGEQVTSVSGSVRTLKDIIQKNHDDANKRMHEAEYARQQVGKVTDQNEALRLALQVKVRANKAGRLENANLSYQQLLTKLQGLYDFLVKWAAHLDAYIEDTDDTVRQEEIKYKTLNTAYGTFKTAMSIIKGNATEEDIYNSTMEYLAEDASRKLGEIDDFQRVAQGFMDNLDIQNGAITDDALKALDAYEAKLLTPGNNDTAFLLPGATSASPVPAKLIGSSNTAGANVAAANNYDDLFRK